MAKWRVAMSHFYVPTQEWKEGIGKDEHYIHIGSGKRLHETDDEWVKEHIVLDDSEEDNIADRNYTYCELTNIYFVWKNMDKLLDKDTEYIGLCHYRRWFDPKLVDEMLETWKPDIICAMPAGIGMNTIDRQYKLAHNPDDWEEFKGYLRECYYHRENTGVTERWLGCPALVAPYNTFIMRREIFLDWSKRLFPVLDDFYRKHKADIDGRDNYQRRAMGFLGERFTSWYVTQQAARKKQVVQLPVIFDGNAKPSDATDARQPQQPTRT